MLINVPDSSSHVGRHAEEYINKSPNYKGKCVCKKVQRSVVMKKKKLIHVICASFKIKQSHVNIVMVVIEHILMVYWGPGV